MDLLNLFFKSLLIFTNNTTENPVSRDPLPSNEALVLSLINLQVEHRLCSVRTKFTSISNFLLPQAHPAESLLETDRRQQNFPEGLAVCRFGAKGSHPGRASGTASCRQSSNPQHRDRGRPRGDLPTPSALCPCLRRRRDGDRYHRKGHPRVAITRQRQPGHG